jgi:hypothetical protein
MLRSPAVFHLVLTEKLATGVVFDVPSRKFVAARIASQQHELEVVESREALFNTFPWAAQMKMKFFLPAPKATLVPAEFYEIEHRLGFFRLNYPFDELAEELEDEPINALPARMIYATAKGRKRSLVYRFPGVVLHHSQAIWLEMLLSQNLRNQVHLLLDESRLHIAAFGLDGLKLFNSYEVHTPEDVLYFTLFVMEQIAISPAESAIFLAGSSSYISPSLVLMKKYVPSISSETLPAGLNYAAPLYDLPQILLFNAYCTALCA